MSAQTKHLPNSSKSLAKKKAIMYLLYLALAMIFLSILLMLLSKLMTLVDIPLSWIVPLATACCVIAIMTASLLLARTMGEGGMVWGALLAAGMYTVLAVCNLVVGESNFSQLALLKLLSILCAGMIGGMVGILLKEHAHRKPSK